MPDYKGKVREQLSECEDVSESVREETLLQLVGRCEGWGTMGMCLVERERERGREGERACHSTPHGFCGSPEASVVHWGLKRSNHTERVCECACQSRRPLAVLSVCITIFLCACTQVEANQALLVYFQTFETHNNYLFRDPHSTHFFKESLTILISC